MDFFTVPTLTGRVLFVLVVLSHHRRQIVHVNITDHPTATWAAQQVIDAFPDDTAPRWLHRDRDRIYGDVFRRRLAGMGIGDVIFAPARPWQNPYVERLIGSIRRECLDQWSSSTRRISDASSPPTAGNTTTFHTAPPRYVRETLEKLSVG
jgi:putative transposase